MPDYYGPAGIFSTDDPGADMRQIEAEEGPWEDWKDEEELLGVFAESFPGQVKLYGCCPACIWWDSVLYWADEPDGLEGAKVRLCSDHHAECPECIGALEFDREEG